VILGGQLLSLLLSAPGHAGGLFAVGRSDDPLENALPGRETVANRKVARMVVKEHDRVPPSEANRQI